MNQPTWDDLLLEDYRERRKPAARHRAERPSTLTRAATTLTTARQTDRDALKAAWYDTDTPAGGLTLLAGLQRPEGPMPS